MLVLLINDIIQLNITSNNKIQEHFQLKETKTGNHGYPSYLGFMQNRRGIPIKRLMKRVSALHQYIRDKFTVRGFTLK